MENDFVLLKRYAHEGDAEALAELVRRHSGLVYATALRVTRNEHDAEDVAQTCFLELAKSAEAVKVSLPGWFHTVATSRATDVLRSKATRARHERAAAEETDESGEAGAAEPTWSELSPLVDETLEGLPEELRVPLVLHFLQARTQADVADEMGVDQSTISRRLDRGVEELRKRLKNVGMLIAVAPLAGLLVENAVVAAPPTLAASLSEAALSGQAGTAAGPAGLSGSTAGTAASAGLFSAKVKLAMGLLAAAIPLATYVALRNWPTPPSPAPPPTTIIEVDPTPVPVKVPPKPVPPFVLVKQTDGLETQTWRKGGWGNPMTFETVEIPERGQVLKVTGGHANQRGTVCALNQRGDLKERPFFAFGIRNDFDHDIRVGIGAVTNAYYEGSFLGVPKTGDFVRIAYDMSQRQFKTAASDWVQGLLLPGMENVRQFQLTAYSANEKDRSGVFLLDNVKLVRGVFEAAELADAPPPGPPAPAELPADFNNDGLLDRLVIGPELRLEIGSAEGTYTPAVGAASMAGEIEHADWGDLDRDGNLDLIVLGTDQGPLSVLLGDGQGQFVDATDDWVFPSTELTYAIRRLYVCDADSDGDEDILLVREDEKCVFWKHRSPNGPRNLHTLEVVSEGDPREELIVRASGPGGEEYGARLAGAERDGTAARPVKAMYHLPAGEYTVSVEWPDGELLTTAALDERGQRVIAAPGQLFTLYPKLPVAIDGRISPGEWDATPKIERLLKYTDIKTDQPEEHPMAIRYFADHYGLYLAIGVEGEDFGSIADFDILFVHFDNDGDGEIEEFDDIKEVWAHIYCDYHMNDPKKEILSRHDILVDGRGAMTHSTRKGIGDYVYELMIPWRPHDPIDIEVTEDATLRVKFVYAESKKFSLPYLAHGWRWANSYDGYPDGDPRRGETYADLIITGLTRAPGAPPQQVRVEIKERRIPQKESRASGPEAEE